MIITRGSSGSAAARTHPAETGSPGGKRIAQNTHEKRTLSDQPRDFLQKPEWGRLI
jgi:hypothetical protein